MTWTMERQREYMRDYYQDNRERWAESRKNETPERREKRLAMAREYQRKHKEQIKERKQADSVRIAKVQYKGRLFKHFGITPEIFEATLAAQDGECAICQEKMQKPVLDHCHEMDKPRALLCNHCNTAIGLFKEDTTKLWAAIGYLEAWDVVKAAMLKAQAQVQTKGGGLPQQGQAAIGPQRAPQQ